MRTNTAVAPQTTTVTTSDHLLRLLIAVALLLLLCVASSAHPLRAAGCEHPRDVSALALAPGGALLAGTMNGGLFRDTGAGCWNALGPLPAVSEIGTLLSVPGPRPALLAGASWLISQNTARWQLYRSVDGGATWTRATAGLPGTQILPVQIAATRAGTLVLAYVCTAYQDSSARGRRCPQGLARSVDGGRSWRPVGPPLAYTRGVVALTDGSLLAAALPRAASSGRLYASRDDGRTWQAIGSFPADQYRSSEENLDGLTRLYAVPWAGRKVLGLGDLLAYFPRLYYTADGGRQWSIAPAPALGIRQPVILTAVAGLRRSRTLLIAALSIESEGGGIYSSTDDGATWRHLGTGLPVDAAIWALLAGPDGATAYAATQAGVYRSVDAGHTWQPAGT
jgi:photosystem II stability/assembly factor-like uncharacterized protein